MRAAFPDVTDERVKEIARESYRGLGRVTIESILLSREPKETVLAAFSGSENWELLEAALARRKEARAAKDFAASDKLRDELAAAGVEVMDGDPLGWDWRPDAN